MAKSHPRFQQLVEDVLRRQFDGNMSAFTKALGLKASGTLKNYLQDKGAPGWEPVLRLAVLAGKDPLEVLRMAGKDREADAIESVFGRPGRILTPIDEWFVTLPDAAKRAVRAGFEASETIREGPARKQSAVK